MRVSRRETVDTFRAAGPRAREEHGTRLSLELLTTDTGEVVAVVSLSRRYPRDGRMGLETLSLSLTSSRVQRLREALETVATALAADGTETPPAPVVAPREAPPARVARRPIDRRDDQLRAPGRPRGRTAP